jgi:hypothetical protein
MTQRVPAGPAAAPSERTLWLAYAALAVLAGLWLRLWQLDGQVLIDDEWHALNRLLVADAGQIATHLGFADYSIPLTLLYRALYVQGWLSERTMHVPAVIAGLALPPMCFVLTRGWLPWRTRLLWAGLLALSPLLVYHSRVARPYAFTALLCPVAVLCFHRWWLARRSGDAIAYVVAAVLAGYLHQVVLPFVLMPLAYYGIVSVVGALRTRSRSAWTPVLRCALMGAIVAALLALALGPPLYVDWQQYTAKAGRDTVTPESVYRTALMLAGSRHAWVMLPMLALAAWGWLRLWRREPDIARYLLVVNGIAAIAVAGAGIMYIYHPLVYARYLLPALVFVLLFVAEGFAGVLDRLRPPAVRPLVAAAMGLVLYAAGPVPAIYFDPNQFTGHLRFQYDYDPAHNPYVQQVPREPVPAFYRDLGKQPAKSLTLVEMPWRLESNFNPHAWYQEVHRQRVLIAMVSPTCGPRTFGDYPEDAGLPMRNFVHLSALLRGETRGADFLVVHLAPWKTPPDAEVEWPDMRACLPRIEAVLGAPIRQDDGLVVFRLAGAARP